MTKIGLRDWVLLTTLVPTLLVSLCLGGYFSYARYHDLAQYLEDQAENIAAPLAIASEHALLHNSRQDVKRLLLPVFARHLSDPKVDFYTVWHNAFEKVNNEQEHIYKNWFRGTSSAVFCGMC